jgi:dipeptidyl aminopeptidase/acylaminoacyl peptidase
MTRSRAIARTAVAASLLAVAWSSAAGQEVHDYRMLAISANGERIAAIESVEPGKSWHGQIVVRDAATGKVLKQVDVCPNCVYDSPAWSPDQKSLAFIASDPNAGTATVYTIGDMKLAGVPITRTTPVATINGVANMLRWSPDGTRIALLATVGARKLTGAAEAGARQVGEIGLSGSEDEQRLAVVPADGASLKFVSPRDTFVYEYDWTPDGKGFVVTSAKGNGDDNWWVATLGHVDAATGRLRILAAPGMQMNMPRVSADGKTVAFIGGLMSDFGSVGGDVYTVPFDGGQPVDVTPGYPGSFNGIVWRGKELLASVLAGRDEAVVAIDPAARASRTLWSKAVMATASRGDGRFVFSANGAIAASVQEDFEHPPRIVTGQLPRLAAITHDNDGAMPQVSARSVAWTNEGFKVQGWLVGPRHVDAGKKYPMIVLVHGGPASAAMPRFVSAGERDVLLRDLTSHGYFVFMPNPRGSFGQGAGFVSANRRDFGGGDWRDILAGVDAAIRQAPIDAARLGLMGHSYGGFMTMWGVTHSQRFKAAVAGAGIANWISYYGQNGIDTWMIPYFGASAYDDPAVYRAASPIESIKAARTPTLIYVGERDVECPAAQSIEFWHGLRAMGTPTALVIYEGEGHALRMPEHVRDLRERILAWFDRYLK